MNKNWLRRNFLLQTGINSRWWGLLGNKYKYWEKEYCTVANIRSDAAEISLWKLKWNCPLMFYKHFFIEEIKINQKRRGILDSKICAEILQDLLEAIGYLPRIYNLLKFMTKLFKCIFFNLHCLNTTWNKIFDSNAKAKREQIFKGIVMEIYFFLNYAV